MRRHRNGTAMLAFVLSDVASFDFGMLVRMSELDFQGERQGRSILNDSQLNGFTQTCRAVDVCGNRRHGMRSQQSLGNPKAVVRTLHHSAPCAVPTAQPTRSSGSWRVSKEHFSSILSSFFWVRVPDALRD